MVVENDHYVVLGLASGEEGAKLSYHEIHKAYKSNALLLHPDKRRDDPNAHANFLKLQNSYEVLKDEKSRKLFDDQLRIERDKVCRRDLKRRRMMPNLEEDDERYSMKHEFARIIALYKKKKQAAAAAATRSSSKREYATDRGVNNAAAATQSSSKEDAARDGGGNDGLETAKVVKVSWNKARDGEDYTSHRLYEIFGKFGCVEEVMIKRKKGSALVVMALKDGAVFATGKNGLGDGSNPLLVELLQSDCQNSVVEKMRKFLG